MEFKPIVRIESAGDYEKAKHDFIQAINSIQKLAPQQRQALAEELFGAAYVTTVMNLINPNNIFPR